MPQSKQNPAHGNEHLGQQSAMGETRPGTHQPCPGRTQGHSNPVLAGQRGQGHSKPALPPSLTWQDTGDRDTPSLPWQDTGHSTCCDQGPGEQCEPQDAELSPCSAQPILSSADVTHFTAPDTVLSHSTPASLILPSPLSCPAH